MSRLFAEAFVVPLLPEEEPAPGVRYDENLALNVLPDGSPFIAAGRAAGTFTFTKVRDEAEDADPARDDGSLMLTTGTKVKAEGDDFAAEASLGTSTETRVRSESADVDSDARADYAFFNLGTVTKTSVPDEADDADRDARADECYSSLGTVTHTFVRAEAEDDDRGAAAFGLGPSTTASAVIREADDLSAGRPVGPGFGPVRLVP